VDEKCECLAWMKKFAMGTCQLADFKKIMNYEHMDE
jgi:hypothetical protein